jgi:hypothetical protein
MLASHGITPVEHDDNSEHRPGINDLRYCPPPPHILTVEAYQKMRLNLETR